MIYQVKNYDSLLEDSYTVGVWEGPDNAEELYRNFLHEKATDMGAVINFHWLNLMDWKLYHPTLTKTEYNRLSKNWRKFLKKHRFPWFLESIGGKRLEYKTVYL
jgi:hypothetical protein